MDKKGVKLLPPTHVGRNEPADVVMAIDTPEFVVRYMVLQSIRQFIKLTDSAPRLLHIPKIVEACLTVDFARNMDQHGKIRDNDTLWDIKVVWDAAEFRIE